MEIKVDNNDIHRAMRRLKRKLQQEGMAQSLHVVATNIGKIPLMPDYSIAAKKERQYTLRNHLGKTTSLTNISE